MWCQASISLKILLKLLKKVKFIPTLVLAINWTLSLDSSSSMLSVYSLFKSSSASSSSSELSSARGRNKKLDQSFLNNSLNFSFLFMTLCNPSNQQPFYWVSHCQHRENIWWLLKYLLIHISWLNNILQFHMMPVICNAASAMPRNFRSYTSLTACTYNSSQLTNMRAVLCY